MEALYPLGMPFYGNVQGVLHTAETLPLPNTIRNTVRSSFRERFDLLDNSSKLT